MSDMKMPNSATNLIKAIKRYCAEGQDDVRLARAMADVVVGQMLPGGVVKGGSSLMFRYGGGVTRYTRHERHCEIIRPFYRLLTRR